MKNGEINVLPVNVTVNMQMDRLIYISHPKDLIYEGSAEFLTGEKCIGVEEMRFQLLCAPKISYMSTQSLMPEEIPRLTSVKTDLTELILGVSSNHFKDISELSENEADTVLFVASAEASDWVELMKRFAANQAGRWLLKYGWVSSEAVL